MKKIKNTQGEIKTQNNHTGQTLRKEKNVLNVKLHESEKIPTSIKNP